MMFSDVGLYLRNISRLRRFHNMHNGERCFIIGNGPSLARMDLSSLKREKTFGLNRIYLHFDRLGFTTTYLVAINRYIVEQFSRDILAAPSAKFISWYLRNELSRSEDVVYLRTSSRERFSRNPVLSEIWEGATVTFVAMQLAYYMGFTKVVLIGVDHSFKTEGPAHKLVVSGGADENHFHPDYFGKGVRWQLPDLETSERAYRLAKDAFEADGRTIVDATLDGKLGIFKKISYTELFS